MVVKMLEIGRDWERERDRAIELFKEKLELQIKDKVKWVKKLGYNIKVILVSLKAWEDEQEVMRKKGSKIYI